jgi:hypothetical protein
MDHPVFGKLTVKEYPWDSPVKGIFPWWNGDIQLPAFDDWDVRWQPGGQNRIKKRTQPKEYDLNIHFKEDKPPPEEPSLAQVKAFQYLQEHQQALVPIVLQGILEYFRAEWEESWQGDWQEAVDLYPKSRKYESRLDELFTFFGTPEGIRETVEVFAVHISAESKEEYAYTGLCLAAAWVDDDGVGVLLHKNRLVAVGDESVAWEGMFDDLRHDR